MRWLRPVNGKKLKDGESVLNEDGKMITSVMVLGDPVPASGVVYLYLPTLSHFKNMYQM